MRLDIRQNKLFSEPFNFIFCFRNKVKTRLLCSEYFLSDSLRLWIIKHFVFSSKTPISLFFFFIGIQISCPCGVWLSPASGLCILTPQSSLIVTHLWACRSILLSRYQDTHTLTCSHRSHVVSSRCRQSCRTDPLRGSGLFMIKKKKRKKIKESGTKKQH